MIPKIASIFCLLPFVAPFRAPDHAQKDFILPIVRPAEPDVVSTQLLPEATVGTAPKFLLPETVSIQQRRATEPKRRGKDRRDENDYWYK